MRKKILVIACYWLIFILAGCLENKEENIIVGKPCIEPEKKGWNIHNVKDIRDKFSSMPVYPTEGAQDDIYLLGKTENFALYGKGNYENLLLESNGCYSEIFYPYTSNYMNPLELYELDIDQDGVLELGIKLQLQKGTDLSIHNFLLADFNDKNELYVYQYREKNFTEDLQSAISFEDAEGGIYPLLNGESTGIYMEDVYKNEPFTSIGVGAIMHFSYDDIKKEIWISGTLLFEREGSVMYETNGSAVKALVGWDGEEFFLSRYQVALDEKK